MYNWAVIKDNVVINLVIADSKENASIAEGDDYIQYDIENKNNLPHIGLSYLNGFFEQPNTIERDN